MNIVEDFIVGLVGRPILFIIKFLRWPFLIVGILFCTLNQYNPIINVTTSILNFIPVIIGFALFSIGTTIKRYDEILRGE